ncbi:MAG: flagellar motor switch protein FliM [Gammaproteobacteria bacterium]|jgi:flagellar motor switch protein FliM
MAEEEQDLEAENVLSDEELDALRNAGNEDGAQDGGSDADGGGHRLFDFRDPARVLNGRMPGLESVHDAFVAGMRQALRALLGRPVEIDVGETALTRLGDYQTSLPMPVSVHSSAVQGRENSMFLIAEGSFVYACVDTFFGGRGGVVPTIEREFSSSERRLTSILARHVFDELKNAWAPLCALNFGDPEVCKPTGMGGLRDDQLMVVSRFHVDLLPGGGEFHLALPYGLLDGLRAYLTAGPRSEDSSRQWRASFVQRVTDVQVQARAVFPGVQVSFSELVSLAPGDFIAISRQNRVNVMVGERVLYSAEPGTSNSLAAAMIVAPGE